MGVWSTGLYSGDFALDLRSTIRAIARLPFDGEKLLDIVCQTEATAAKSPDDADHSTFWLVAADQFAKRGIVSNRAREAALKIIDEGRDIAMLEKLGMDPAGLRKRRKVLEELRTRIVAPPSVKPRSVLKKPQPYLMDIGDVLIYPTCEGNSINPYFALKEQDPSWKGQDGWSAAVIVNHGRAFEFLAWYRPLTLAAAPKDKPTLAALRGELLWTFDRAGTCSANHYKKMELEKIGVVSIDWNKLVLVPGALRPGTSAAIDDISIANAFRRHSALGMTRMETIPRLGEILADSQP
jgi:hypothetical protein